MPPTATVAAPALHHKRFLNKERWLGPKNDQCSGVSVRCACMDQDFDGRYTVSEWPMQQVSYWPSTVTVSKHQQVVATLTAHSKLSDCPVDIASGNIAYTLVARPRIRKAERASEQWACEWTPLTFSAHAPYVATCNFARWCTTAIFSLFLSAPASSTPAFSTSINFTRHVLVLIEIKTWFLCYIR